MSVACSDKWASLLQHWFGRARDDDQFFSKTLFVIFHQQQQQNGTDNRQKTNQPRTNCWTRKEFQIAIDVHSSMVSFFSPSSLPLLLPLGLNDRFNPLWPTLSFSLTDRHQQRWHDHVRTVPVWSVPWVLIFHSEVSSLRQQRPPRVQLSSQYNSPRTSKVGAFHSGSLVVYFNRNDEIPSILQKVMRIQSENTRLIGLCHISKDCIDHT